MSIRKQINALLVAGNGEGKTIWILEFILIYNEAHPEKRILIGLPDDSESKFLKIPEIELEDLPYFTGIKKIIINGDEFYREFQDYFSNKENNFDGLFINDDPGAFMGRRPTNILAMFSRRRQLNVDFIWTFHGWNTTIPRGFFTFITSIIMGKTSDNPEYTLKLLPEDKQQQFMKNYNEINELYEKGIKYQFRELVLKNLY